MENGYKHYYNYLLNEYEPEDVMVLTPTKKNKLGTVQINKYIQSIVNSKSDDKLEYEYGQDNENVIRVGDYVLNTTNMYRVKNLEETTVDIVNGDSGKIIDLKFEDDKRDDDEELLECEKKGIVIEFDTGAFRIDFRDVFQLLVHGVEQDIKRKG